MKVTRLSIILSIVGLLGVGGIVASQLYLHDAIKKQVQVVPGSIEKPTRVIAVGDLACESDREETATECRFEDVVKGIRKRQPDTVLLLGDLQYHVGAPEEFVKSFGRVWSDLKQISYSVPGNHEYLTKDAKGYFDYWNGGDQSSKQAGDRTKGYFATQIAGWKVLALNSNCEFVSCRKDSEQGKWLQEQLKETPKCTLAMWHHPHFTSGTYALDEVSKARGSDFWELLDDAKADLILNGHDHVYERFARQHFDQTLDNQTGVRQIIVGTGGRSVYAQQRAEKNQEKIINNDFGFLELDLVSTGYQWRFINEAGNVMDSGSNECSRS